MVQFNTGILGAGSDMPISMYLDKLEQTCISEDPEQIDNYFRGTLKDVRPDAPFFESDSKRSNTYANDFINLRFGGARVNTRPDLPDGTFLDYAFLEKDPRGIALEPDMKEHRKQQEARGKFIKFYADNDDSILESGRTPQQVIRENKNQFYAVKNRMKIFDESFNGRQNGGASIFKLTTKGECMQKTDDRSPDMRDEMCYNRANKVNDLSNNTSIGWRRTTDHQFKVAHYGKLRKSALMSNNDVTKNRSNAQLDSMMMVQFRDKNVPKSLALKMIDLSKRRESEMRNGNTLILQESMQDKVRQMRKLSREDLEGIKAQNTEMSQGAVANVIINGTRTQHVTGGMVAPVLDSNRTSKVNANVIIVKQMVSVNRALKNDTTDDLRDSIKQSGESYTLLNIQGNKQKSNVDIKNELLWESVANFERGKSMKIANYQKLASTTTINKPKNQDDYDFEEYKKEQMFFGQRRGNIDNPDMYNMETIEYDNDVGPETIASKMVGGLGSKYTRNYLASCDLSGKDSYGGGGLGEISSSTKYIRS